MPLYKSLEKITACINENCEDEDAKVSEVKLYKHKKGKNHIDH